MAKEVLRPPHVVHLQITTPQTYCGLNEKDLFSDKANNGSKTCKNWDLHDVPKVTVK